MSLSRKISGTSISALSVAESTASISREAAEALYEKVDQIFLAKANGSNSSMTHPGIDENTIKNQLTNLLKWLQTNRVQPEQKSNGDLVLFDTVTIKSPYDVDSCFSNNELVLERVKRLVSQVLK